MMAAPSDPALKPRVLQLIEEGLSERATAKAVGVSRTTVRAWLGRIPQKVGSTHEELQATRVRVFKGLAALVEERIAAKNLTGMRDLMVAYGIADDKVAGRKQGGVEVNTDARTVNMIRIAPDVG